MNKEEQDRIFDQTQTGIVRGFATAADTERYGMILVANGRYLDGLSDNLAEARDLIKHLRGELRDVKERANGYWNRCREERADREEAEARHREDLTHLLSRIGQAIGEIDKGKRKKARKILMAALDETSVTPTPTLPPF